MYLVLLLILAAAPVALWLVVKRKTQRAQVLDLGVTFAAIVFLYAAIPLLGFWLANAGIGNMLDERFGYLPDESTILEVGWCYAAFLLTFVASYGWATETQRTPVMLWAPRKADFQLALLVWAALKVGLLAAVPLLGARQAENYADSYLVLSHLPLIVQQVMGAASSMELGVTVLLVVTAIAYRPRLRWHMAVLVVMNIGLTFVERGARTPAFLSAFAYVVAITMYGGLSTKARLAFAVAGLIAFSIAGAIRGEMLDVGAIGLLQSGEFVLVFHNAIDLLQRAAAPEDMGIRGFYIIDLLRVIPQQIIEWKVSPAAVYVETYYPAYAAAGGGLAFGAISEAVIGYGWPEALVRGALLGMAYAWVANRCLQGQLSGMRLFVYVWFVVMAYQGVRDTTFSVFARFPFHLFPVLVLLWMTGRFRRHASATERAAASGAWQR